MDGIGIIVIVFVVITIFSAISAATKKKPSGNGEEGEAPRRAAMSDIQRAFMMMSGFDSDEDERKRTEVLSGFKAPPPPVSNNTAYGEGFTGSEGAKASEGRLGYEGKSDFGSVPSGSLRGDTPIEQAGFKSDYRTEPSGSLRGNTAIEAEAGVYKYVAASETIKEAVETVEDDEAPLVQELKDDLYEDDMIHEDAPLKRRSRPALKLFENKNDYVKAVIFSEVLERRPPAGRAAVKR